MIPKPHRQHSWAMGQKDLGISYSLDGTRNGGNVLKHNRVSSSSLVVGNGERLLLVGGADIEASTTELIVQEQTNNATTIFSASLGPDAPHIHSHCLASIGPTVAISVGGMNANSNSNAFNPYSYILRWDQMAVSPWTLGPYLQESRMFHVCGVVRESTPSHSERKVVAVAGGITPSGAQTRGVELLLVESENDIASYATLDWQEGPMLPKAILQAASATTADQSRLFVAGGMVEADLDKQETSSIMTLTCSSGMQCQWTRVHEMLELHARGLAFILPAMPMSSRESAYKTCSQLTGTRACI